MTTATLTTTETRITPEEWPGAIADCEGAQIAVGGPGTGKTEFLARRALHLIEQRNVPAGRILVLAFGRRGTADLDRRIRSGLTRSVPHIDVTTFHSLAARILERHASESGWDTTPEILTGPEQVDLVQRLLSGSDRSRWSPAFRGLLGSQTFAREVTDFVLRAGEQLLTAESVAALAATRDEWRGLGTFLDDYHAELRACGRIDYGTLLAAAIRILENRPDAGRVARDTSYVLVDEYQDTTVAQARLLELLTASHRNLTVAADPYQSIYSFRGADLHNVARFPRRFRDAEGNPGKRIVLTTSFRTPRAILDAAVRVTSGDLPGAAGRVLPAPGNGRVDVYRFEQETAEAEWIADEMQRLHYEEGIPYAEMAVFARSKQRFLPDLIRALDRRDVPHEAPDGRLAEHAAVRFVLDLIAAATGTDGPAETARAVRRVLLGPMYALPLGVFRTLEQTRLADPNGSWANAIRAVAPEASDVADLLDDDSWAAQRPADEGLWHVWSLLDAIPSVVREPDRASDREAWSSLSQVVGRWSERNPGATLSDYRRLAEEEDFEARPLLSYRHSAGDRPTITTLHQSKGLEFEVVFIADAVEGVFPDLRSRDSLLGVRHLVKHLPADAAAYRAFRLQEERRLAYTAMTRSRRRVVWTATAAGFEEGRGIPSRFLALAAGTATVAEASDPPPARSHPVTPREAEGMMRRALVDVSLSPATRLAALRVITERRRPDLRDPNTFVGMLTRGRDDGVISDDHTLSPSQAESYDSCPRRYVMQRLLHIGDAGSPYADFGALIHGVLEVVEREAADAGRAHGTAARAAQVFTDRFDPAVFGGPPYAEGWFRRGLKALEHLYANWPSAGSVVAAEVPLRLTLGGAEWIGYADRIETAGDDGVAVVDYKTSTSVPRISDAAASLQLGYYVLAAAADADLSAHGPPRGAEMWFPVAGGKSVKRRAFDFDRLQDVAHRLAQAAAGILAEDWAPTPGDQCDRCPLRGLCPAWREGREAFI